MSLVLSWAVGYTFSLSPGHPLVGYSTDYLGLHRLPATAGGYGAVSEAAARLRCAKPCLTGYLQWALHAVVSALPSTIVGSAMCERAHPTGQLLLAIR